MTSRITSAVTTVDNRYMASLPALRTFAGLHRTPTTRPASTPFVTKPDPKAIVARRLRAQDASRSNTSIAPPTRHA